MPTVNESLSQRPQAAGGSMMHERDTEPLETTLAPDGRLAEILEEISAQVYGVRAIVIGDRNGLPIASSLGGRPSMAATAMATFAMTAAGKITRSLYLPNPEDITIHAGSWNVVILSLGDGCTLAAVAGPKTAPASLSWIMRLHAEEIRELLDIMRRRPALNAGNRTHSGDLGWPLPSLHPPPRGQGPGLPFVRSLPFEITYK